MMANPALAEEGDNEGHGAAAAGAKGLLSFRMREETE